MTDFTKRFYPGKRVEVLIFVEIGSYWLRGTVTEPRDPNHKGKIRVWLDQSPSGWQTFEVLFPMSAGVGSLIRPFNQPDRIITPLWELNSIFFFSSPVLVTDGGQIREGVVIKPPWDGSPKIGFRLLKGQGEGEIPYDPRFIKRIHGRGYCLTPY